jgi:hypothetical protein
VNRQAPFAIRPIGRVVGHLGSLRRRKRKLIGAIFISPGMRVAFQRQ